MNDLFFPTYCEESFRPIWGNNRSCTWSTGRTIEHATTTSYKEYNNAYQILIKMIRIKLYLYHNFYYNSKYPTYITNTRLGVARWSWWQLHNYSISCFINSTFTGFCITSQLFSWSFFSKLEWYESYIVISAFLYQNCSYYISIDQKTKICYLPVQPVVKTTDFLIGSWNTIISGPTYSLFTGWTTGCCCWAAF